jgi:predicted phage replisome organizer
MSEVKWIKIVTDIFDDEKILLIESMPDADSIIVMWFKLLCLAGRQNNSGVFMLNGRIPYTDEMFATIFRRPLNTVRLALKVFEQYGMIEIINNAVTIPNWSKHQTLDQIELNREYMREYVAKRRAEQKALTMGKVNGKINCQSNVNAADIDIEEDKEKDKSSKKRQRFTPPTLDEVSAYCKERGNKVDPQKWWDFYASKGWKVGNNPMKDWQASVRTWEREDNSKRSTAKADPRAAQNYSQRTYTNDLVDLYSDSEVM